MKLKLVVILAVLICLQACSQGIEFKVGFGQYNGAVETRTYTAEKKNQ